MEKRRRFLGKNRCWKHPKGCCEELLVSPWVGTSVLGTKKVQKQGYVAGQQQGNALQMCLKKNPATWRQFGRTHHIGNHHFPSFSSNQDKAVESITPSRERHPSSSVQAGSPPPIAALPCTWRVVVRDLELPGVGDANHFISITSAAKGILEAAN